MASTKSKKSSARRSSAGSAKKKSSSRKRTSSSRKSKTSSYTRKKGKSLSYFEAARASGALNEDGTVMTKGQALASKTPIVGYLPRKMIADWHNSDWGGAGARKGSKRYNEAVARFQAGVEAMKKTRASRGSGWTIKKGALKGPAKTEGGRFRRGRGPKRSLTLYRGFSPTQKQIAELIEGGYAGPMSAAGGKVKLNRSKTRRRKKASTRRRTPPRGKSGRFVRSSVKSNPTKARRRKGKKKAVTSMAVYNNPKRRKAKKSKAKRRSAKKSVAKNPARKYRRKKASVKRNPAKRRRRSYRRNPGIMGLEQVQNLRNVKFWVAAAHVGVGAGLTGLLSDRILANPMAARLRFMPGVAGSLARIGVTALSAAGISYLGGLLAKTIGKKGALKTALEGASKNLMIGGMTYTVVRAGYEFLPGLAGKVFPAMSAPAQHRALPPAAGETMTGYGPDYRYGYGDGGMGMVLSPEDLVAGESLSRSVNEFHGMNDWMELSGLSGSGGQPVPIEDLRGYPGQYGMGDWVDLAPNSQLVQQGFDPGSENF